MLMDVNKTALKIEYAGVAASTLPTDYSGPPTVRVCSLARSSESLAIVYTTVVLRALVWYARLLLCEPRSYTHGAYAMLRRSRIWSSLPVAIGPLLAIGLVSAWMARRLRMHVQIQRAPSPS